MRHAPRAVRWTFAVIAVWLVLAEIRNVFFKDADVGPLFDRFVHDGVIAIAGALCVWRALTRREERLPWLLIGLGVLAWTFGEVYYTAVLWTVEDVPIPSPADAGYLLMPVLLLPGLVLLLKARVGHVPPTLRADGLTAALAVGAVSAALVFDASVEAASGDPLGVATTLGYPIGDLVLGSFVVGALAGMGWRPDRTWILIGAGIFTFWIADSFYLVQTAQGTFESNSWFDAGWWAGLVLICAAAFARPLAPDAEPPQEGLRLIAMPLLFGLIGLSLLIYGSFAPLNPLAVILAAAALLAVMGRLILAFRENTRMLHTSRDEALTDALTGLPNRRALSRRLERALPRGDGAPLVLALFDLDGFKIYNDTFGHPAGDALLARLAGNLRAYLDGRGEAFRMGGDEFCALFEPGDRVVEPIVAGAARALSESGEGFSIGCSYGSILLPREATDASDALRIADGRMYVQKAAGRASAGRQTRDVLLRVLAERDPRLHSRTREIARVAEAVARRLALSEEEAEHVRHAAELQDVGKTAIPDAILRKRGPLDEGEWAFVRRHTVVGERIIAAAPALRPVAALVRSSQERWDGTGYPDRLAGRDILLGSRIVSVADAYDAMTAERPYRGRRTPAEALDELRRCAGTQFDPEVVEAFCDAWNQLRTPAPTPPAGAAAAAAA